MHLLAVVGLSGPQDRILANYLVQRDRSFLEDKTVLELGSGTGLVGIVAARLGAKVWVTDQASVITRRASGTFDDSRFASQPAVGYHAAECTEKPSHFVMYCCRTELNRYQAIYPFRTWFSRRTVCILSLRSHSSSKHSATSMTRNPRCCFCYKKRRKADKRFFAMLKKKFTWEQVDDPDREIYNRDSITLVRLYRLK
ncbi:hypothetical protein F5146DRAFT_594894 [Armillaria mellea]|nr:hypothetical protein F5146DRAFT_594894 [Armillaria mellea]